MDDILKDSRFAKYINDPRYRQIPKHERKVRIDKRFQSMFNDDKFKVKYTVDKRGRPVNETSTENLRKYYEIEDSGKSGSDQESEEDGEISGQEKKAKETIGRFVRRHTTNNEDSEQPTKFKNDKLVRGKLDPKTKERLLDLDVDYARGEGKFATNKFTESYTQLGKDRVDSIACVYSTYLDNNLQNQHL